MVYVPAENGTWVNEEYERLAAVISDFYGPQSASQTKLELRWIPPDKRTTTDKYAYVIVDVATNQAVIYASEMDSPVDILERLFISDMSKGNVLKRLEAREDAERILKLKAYKDRMDEAKDKALFLMTSPLNYLHMDGKKFDSERRVIKRESE